jgi:anhydro-N-acetylmuramic acid kinase
MVATRWVIGVASGANCDGVDAALLELEGCGLGLCARVLRVLHEPLADEVCQLTRSIARSPCDQRDLSLANRLLGESFAAAARHTADQAGFSLQKVQCLGCSGHTIWGDPEGRFPSLLSLGMPAVIAERCGVTTVSDFRSRDLAAGGLGAPLAALADYILFRSYYPDEHRLMIHLGSVAQIIHLPPNCRVQEIAGFDAGPCNLLLDALIQHMTNGQEQFDAGGKHAVQGRCLEPLLERWLHHHFLQRRPPRMLPRYTFGEAFAVQALRETKEQNGGPFDLLCTATHFVVRAIVHALDRYLSVRNLRDRRVLLSGGGTRNGLLRHLLQQQIGPAEETDVAGVPWQARKAAAAGILAALCLDGVPANLPQATGAAGSRLLGSVTPGSMANWARCLPWMAQQISASVSAQAA